MKKRSITLPSGVVDTFTLFIVSSSSQRTSVTSTRCEKAKDQINWKIYLFHKCCLNHMHAEKMEDPVKEGVTNTLENIFWRKLKVIWEKRGYHARVLFYLENTRISKETHPVALAAAGFQAGKSRFEKSKNMKDKLPKASSSTNSTLWSVSQPPKRLSSTICHPLIHLQQGKPTQNSH